MRVKQAITRTENMTSVRNMYELPSNLIPISTGRAITVRGKEMKREHESRSVFGCKAHKNTLRTEGVDGGPSTSSPISQQSIIVGMAKQSKEIIEKLIRQKCACAQSSAIMWRKQRGWKQSVTRKHEARVESSSTLDL